MKWYRFQEKLTNLLQIVLIFNQNSVSCNIYSKFKVFSRLSSFAIEHNASKHYEWSILFSPKFMRLNLGLEPSKLFLLKMFNYESSSQSKTKGQMLILGVHSSNKVFIGLDLSVSKISLIKFHRMDSGHIPQLGSFQFVPLYSNWPRQINQTMSKI